MVDEQVTVHVLARAFGIDLSGLHDKPEFTWRVAGVALPAARLDRADVRATVSTTVQVGVPASGDQVWNTEQRTIDLQARAAWDSLAVECLPGDGRYEVSIEVTVSPQPGWRTAGCCPPRPAWWCRSRPNASRSGRAWPKPPRRARDTSKSW